jgi:hypothetical protein
MDAAQLAPAWPHAQSDLHKLWVRRSTEPWMGWACLFSDVAQIVPFHCTDAGQVLRFLRQGEKEKVKQSQAEVTKKVEPNC